MIAPSAAPSQWDYLYVAGQRAPGVVRISGAGLVIGWDIQNPQGMMGGVTRRIGDPIKEFDAEFYLSDETDSAGQSDFDRWDPFQKLLLSSVPPAMMLGASVPTRPGGKPYPLDVVHPDLARLRITSATFSTISPLASDGKGGGTIKVHFIEYRPPRPMGSVKLTKTAGDAKIEGAMKEIEALQKEWRAL